MKGHMKKVIIYDATENTLLGMSWALGACLYKLLGRANHVIAARTWEQAFSELVNLRDVDEVQYWGHGSPGTVYLNGFELPMEMLKRAFWAMSDTGTGMWWWRTCASFSGARGQRFAMECVKLLGVAVAGSTYNIGFWHSGVHVLSPGETPYWSLAEGEGDGKLLMSGAKEPNTILFLGNTPPEEISK
jgi:hypothetical protein